jgi:hypothetical protein
MHDLAETALDELGKDRWHTHMLQLFPQSEAVFLRDSRQFSHAIRAAFLKRFVASPLWTDVKILLRTVPHVIGRRGL